MTKDDRGLFWIIGLLSLLLCGCGGSDRDDVTGQVGSPTQSPAGLSFRFARARALALPDEVTRLRFAFFEDRDGEGQMSQSPVERDFAPLITINPVSLRTRSVVITALDDQNDPALRAVVEVLPRAGVDLEVDLGAARVTIISPDPSAPPVLSYLQVTPDGDTMIVGGLKQMSVSGFDQDARPLVIADPVVWSSSNPGVASVEPASGRITALAAGEVEIKATVGTVQGRAILKVRPPSLVGLRSVTPASLSLAINETATVTVVGQFESGPDRTLTGADGLNLLVDADRPAVRIGSEGQVTAVAFGNTTITVSVGSERAEIPVTVSFNASGNSAPVLTFDDSLLLLRQGQPQSAFSQVVLQDDQVDFAGGRLSFSVQGGARVEVPSAVDIGRLETFYDGYAIDLDQRATLEAVAAHLRGVRVYAPESPTSWEGWISVSFEDGQGAYASTPYRLVQLMKAESLVIRVPEDVGSLAAAVQKVVAEGDAYSIIRLPAGGQEPSLTISNLPELEGLRIEGANRGRSAGPGFPVYPAPTRLTESVIAGLTIEAPNVTLNGLSIPGSDNRAVDLSATAVGFQLLNSVLENGGGAAATGVTFLGGGTNRGFNILDNRFIGWATAVRLEAASGALLREVTVQSNLFEGNSGSLELARTWYPWVYYNAFVDSADYHVNVKLESGGAQSARINFNDILGTGKVRLTTTTSAYVECAYCWWGQSGGPLPSQYETIGGGQPFSVPYFSDSPQTGYVRP